jgi:hypothetical protein
LGDTVLLVVVGLSEAALNGDLELQVGVVGDSLELGKARPTEEGVVDVGEVDHLEGERFLGKVVRLAEGDIEPDAPEGHDFLPWNNPIERCLAGVHAAPRDAHLVEGDDIEYVEAAAPSNSTLVRHVVPTIGLIMSG